MSEYKRQIVLDTETTGLEHRQGHRIIEIGCVELINRKLTGNNYHIYSFGAHFVFHELDDVYSFGYYYSLHGSYFDR